MFGIASDNPELSCPHCHRPMTDMARYYDSLGTGVSIDIGSESPLLIQPWRRRWFINPVALLEGFGNMVESLLNVGRDRKGAKLCREILPLHPRSQICTECLYVYRRS